MTLQIPTTPVISTNNQDLKSAQKFALEFCRSNYVGKSYLNAETGDLIAVSSKGIKHSLHVAKPPLIRAMYILPDIIKAASKTGVLPDKIGRPDIVCVHKYEAEMQGDDGLLIALIVAREDNQGIKHFYDLGFLSR